MEERMHSVHSACALGVSAALVLTLCAAPQAAFASESADSLDASLGALSASADESQAPFSDVSGGEWYAQIVDRAYTLGLLTGYEGTDLFGPSDGMTRGQMVVVLKRLTTLIFRARRIGEAMLMSFASIFHLTTKRASPTFPTANTTRRQSIGRCITISCQDTTARTSSVRTIRSRGNSARR